MPKPRTIRRHRAPSVSPDDSARERAAELVALGADEAASRLSDASVTTDDSALAIVEALGSMRSEEAGHILAAVAADVSDKDLRKAARRALHRLRAAGIAVEVPAPIASPPVPAGGEPARVTDAYASFVDGVGSRSIWLCLERSFGGVDTFGLVANLYVGVKDTTYRDTTRKRFTRMIEDWREEHDLTLVELPPEYALSLVSEAVALNAQERFPLPTEFQLHRRQLGELPPPPTEPLIYQHVSRGQSVLLPNLLESSGELFEQKEMEGWLFDYPQTLPHAQNLKQAQESRIILAGASREERESRAIDGAMTALFTPEARRAIRRSLEENAYVFWKTDRERAARTAVAAAGALGDGSLGGHPFARAMVERSIQAALEAERLGLDPATLRYGPRDVLR